jgi:hypothetical protein
MSREVAYVPVPNIFEVLRLDKIWEKILYFLMSSEGIYTLLLVCKKSNNSYWAFIKSLVCGHDTTKEDFKIMMYKAKNVTRIILDDARITDDWLWYIHSKVTTLSLGIQVLVTGKGFEYLPLSIKNFRIAYSGSTRTIRDELKFLPSSIEYLSIVNSGSIPLNYLPINIKNLNLKCCSIRDDALKDLHPNITILNISSCIYITDKGLEYLHPNITCLDISRCKHITDEGLKYIPKGIKVLNVYECPNITYEGLNYYIPLNIETLNILGGNTDGLLLHTGEITNLFDF